MARKLSKYSFRRTGHSKYPWEQWGDGNIWRLTEGEDYTVDSIAFRAAAYTAAKRIGKKCRTNAEDGATVIQFYG